MTFLRAFEYIQIKVKPAENDVLYDIKMVQFMCVVCASTLLQKHILSNIESAGQKIFDFQYE